MTWIDGLLIFISILLGYFLITFILQKKGVIEKYGMSLSGPFLLLKTKKGLNFLKKISNKKIFWRRYGNFAVILCFVLMIVMIVFFIWQINLLSEIPPEKKVDLPGPEFALVLPGINPILPLDYLPYIIIAFIVAIIVHEFSHGIMAYVGDLKVKSMGIVYLIIPIGAFVEPDEKQLKKTTIHKRLRVFAAGPTANFIVVLVCLLIFSFVFMSAVQPGSGLTVYEVYEESPAYDLGIRKGSIITSINDSDLTKIDNQNDKFISYTIILNSTKANDTINISYITNGNLYNKKIKLDDKYNYIESYGDINITKIKGKGETGIFSFVDEKNNLDILKNLPLNRDRILFYISLPIMGYFDGYNPLVSPFTESYEITGPLSSLPAPVFWGSINLLYWIFWLNLMVGLFNVIPMLPLDGGYLFNDYIRLVIKKVKREMNEEKTEKIVGNISLVVSLIILFMVIFPFIFKYI